VLRANVSKISSRTGGHGLSLAVSKPRAAGAYGDIEASMSGGQMVFLLFLADEARIMFQALLIWA
jgi:nitrogen-specific signal transduction histidine kinase